MDRCIPRRLACRWMACAVVAIAAAVPASRLHAAPRHDGELHIDIIDAETGQPSPARMHLRNSRGRPVKLRLPGTAEFEDHFYIDGAVTLPLRRGQYTFELDAGPEFRPQSGHFEIDRHADDRKRIEIHRVVNLADEGWWAGDLDVSRKDRDLPLILRAEKLKVADASAVGLQLVDSAQQSESVGPQSAVARVPYAWSLPVWLARDELAAIQLIHHHALRSGTVDHEEEGRPRDRSVFPGRTGNGRWSERVYYHVLNCGLRIPPAAGSGSGTNGNPVGVNRVYVHCGETFSEEAWRDGLLAGRVFVTNGPLLRTRVEGRPPGHVFHIEAGGSIAFEIGVDLATRVPIEYLQIIKNGQVEVEVRLSDWKNRQGRLPPAAFEESGWFLVRAVTANTDRYQFASSGPYYVESVGVRRISRRSVQFFLEWILEAEARIQKLGHLPDRERDAMLAEQAQAREFFQALLAQANAE